MPTPVVEKHPCEVCKEPTTNPRACSRSCSCKLARRKSGGSQKGPRPHRRVAPEKRFLSFVPNRPDTNECWTWYGACSKLGYPLIWDSEKGCQAYAHRLSWEMHRGPIPKGHVVSQVCENFGCTNPKHLVCGPRGKIVAKRLRLNRKTARYGDRNASSLLSDADVKLIRQLHSERNFKAIKVIAEERGTRPDYALAVGRSKGRKRKSR